MDPAPSDPFAVLASPEGYRARFMDPGLWQPFVVHACRRHGLEGEAILPGRAGTFPTFLVDGRWVVKFFGPLFAGETCWLAELEAAVLLRSLPELPLAELIASGTLEPAPDWHYLVFRCVPGVSIGEVYEQVAPDQRLALAGWLGGLLHKLHRLPLPPGTVLPRLSERLCRGWFAARWPEDRRRWPARLAGEVEGYLKANTGFLQAGAGCFIHADLTQDHLFGRLEDGRWTSLALIDFGDAMLGNLFYELAALHLDLFGCDRRLLRAFLEAYGLDEEARRDFVPKAMVTCLLHQFDVVGHLFEWDPALREAASLDELAGRLWNVAADTP